MPANETTFTLRRCLLLCLPALIIGGVLRIAFLVATPQIYYGSDSNSYFTTAHELWNNGELDLPTKRRWLYPPLVAAVVALPGSTAVGMAVLQHVVGLAIVVGIGWITGHVTRRPTIWVPMVTCLAALWPRMLWYEHELIAESFVLAGYVLTVALAFPLSRLCTARGLLWFLLGAALMLSFKPHGRPIWLAIVFLGALYTWKSVPWRWSHWTTVAVSVVILVTGGSSSQGSWLLLSSALPLVKTEGAKWQEYRDVLRPTVEDVRRDLPNYTWAQGRYKKQLNSKDPDGPLGPKWAALVRDKKTYAKVTKALAVEAVLSEPVTYTWMVLRKIMLALADASPGQKIDPQIFWQQQDETNEGRWETPDRAAEMKLIYGTDAAGYQTIAARGRAQTLFFAPFLSAFTKAVAWTTYRPVAGQPPLIRFRWSGCLLVFGLFTCLWPSRFWRTAFVWFPALIYCGLIFAVGDAVTRYLHPVDWCWLVIIALGLDSVCDGAVWLFAKARPAPVPGMA